MRKVKIRNPESTRPWQHVLEPLSGYLLLGQKLLEGAQGICRCLEFRTRDGTQVTVGEITEQVKKIWPVSDFEIAETAGQPHEAGKLQLDCSKARNALLWGPVWSGENSVEITVKMVQEVL